MIKCTFLTFILFPLVVIAQQVTTIVSDPSTRFRDDLIFDAAGNLYCSDYPGNSVYRRSPDGVITTFASGFNTPNGLAFDSQDNLFVADNLGNRIYKLDSNGQFLDTFAITGPSGLIKMPDSDTLLFTQYPGNTLNKLAPDGTVVPVFSGAPINGAVGLAWSPDERLYMANFSNSMVFEVIFGTEVTLDSIATIPGPAQGNAWLGFIEFANGFIWATAYSAHKIYKINPADGQVILVAGSVSGSTDGDITTARFSNPNGIVASSSGDTLYISDYGTGRLRMMTDISMAIGEVADVHLEVFPNPVTNNFSVVFSKDMDAEYLELLDLSGKQLVVWTKPVSGTSFSTTGLSAGSYILRCILRGTTIDKLLLID